MYHEYLDENTDREDDEVHPMNVLNCPSCGVVASTSHTCPYCGEHCND